MRPSRTLPAGTPHDISTPENKDTPLTDSTFCLKQTDWSV